MKKYQSQLPKSDEVKDDPAPSALAPSFIRFNFERLAPQDRIVPIKPEEAIKQDAVVAPGYRACCI